MSVTLQQFLGSGTIGDIDNVTKNNPNPPVFKLTERNSVTDFLCSTFHVQYYNKQGLLDITAIIRKTPYFKICWLDKKKITAKLHIKIKSILQHF